MIAWLKRLFAKPEPEPKPLPNAHLLGFHIAEASRKGGANRKPERNKR